VREKISLEFYKKIMQRWRKEAKVNCCYGNERIGIEWWRVGIWKMRGIRKGFEKGRCPLCYEEADVTNISENNEVERRISM
jgi:hypothetical protein